MSASQRRRLQHSTVYCVYAHPLDLAGSTASPDTRHRVPIARDHPINPYTPKPTHPLPPDPDPQSYTNPCLHPSSSPRSPPIEPLPSPQLHKKKPKPTPSKSPSPTFKRFLQASRIQPRMQTPLACLVFHPAETCFRGTARRERESRSCSAARRGTVWCDRASAMFLGRLAHVDFWVCVCV